MIKCQKLFIVFDKNITDEATRKSFICGEELTLNADGVLDNLVDFVLDGLVDQVLEHEAGEVCVKPLVPQNQLVVKVEDGHQDLVLQDPVAFLESIHWRVPRESVYGVEELVSVLPVLDVAGVDMEGLYLTDDVLHHYLEAIEAPSLWNIDLYDNKVAMIL